jgi:hypothetical protein
MIGEEPLPIGDLAEDLEAWAAYDSQDLAGRRTRWTEIVTAWVAGTSGKAEELLGQLSLMELVDLDATLDSLRLDLRRAVEKLTAQEQPVDDG